MLFVVRPTIETHNKDRKQIIQIGTKKSIQSRFKALQALFLMDIAHYNHKGGCGLSRGLKWLAIMLHFSCGEA